MRLDPAERRHLFQLAEMPDTTPPDHATPSLRPQVQVILDGLNPMPASVVTERFDILAWNTAHAVLFPRTTLVAPAERNTLLYCFSRADCRNVIENREEQRGGGRRRRAPGPGQGTPYDLGTNRANSPQIRSGYSKLTLSYRFHRSSHEPPITAIQSIILQAQVVTCIIIRNTG